MNERLPLLVRGKGSARCENGNGKSDQQGATSLRHKALSLLAERSILVAALTTAANRADYPIATSRSQASNRRSHRAIRPAPCPVSHL